MSRLTAIFRKLDRGDRAQFLSPETWKDQDVISATAFYKDHNRKLKIKQRDILTRWTPETSVPPFNLLKAAGNPGHWNNLSFEQCRGGKDETLPPLKSGVPDFNKFEEFLTIRKLEDGSSTRDLFSKREARQDGWEMYTFKMFEENELPTRSICEYKLAAGRNGDTPQYANLYHGIKVEGAYAILAGSNTQAGGLQASSDKTKGQRFNEDKVGVYFHAESDFTSALTYAHWVPLFSDGCYVRIVFECTVDRSHRVPYKHFNQKVQQPNSLCSRPGTDTDPYTGGPSIFLARMHVQILGFQDLPKGDMYSMIWNERAEARPEFINRLYGTNQDESICLVVFPPEIETELERTSSNGGTLGHYYSRGRPMFSLRHGRPSQRNPVLLLTQLYSRMCNLRSYGFGKRMAGSSQCNAARGGPMLR
jgi:hypothetical protein